MSLDGEFIYILARERHCRGIRCASLVPREREARNPKGLETECYTLYAYESNLTLVLGPRSISVLQVKHQLSGDRAQESAKGIKWKERLYKSRVHNDVEWSQNMGGDKCGWREGFVALFGLHKILGARAIKDRTK